MNVNVNQQEKIELFLLEIKESELYSSKEYLIHSIRKNFLNYLSVLRLNEFKPPLFLTEIFEFINKLFDESGIYPTNMLEYMLENDISNWIYYYVSTFFRSTSSTITDNEIKCNNDLFILILTGFVFEYFREKSIDIRTIIPNEKLPTNTNQYGLSKVNGVVFKRDYFIYDHKAYLYNLLTNTSVINFFDKMPGFAKIIIEQVTDGDILLRLDERLALPENQAISYSTYNFEKFRGPQFHFNNSTFDKKKTIIVHIDNNTCDKLLMVIKQDYNTISNEEFWHIELETLPFISESSIYNHFITVFLHGMYYPNRDCFTHIDYTRNQYDISDYLQKYSDSVSGKPIDFYTRRELHYKIWCIENGTYSREVWYNLMVSSLSEVYQNLLNEILS